MREKNLFKFRAWNVSEARMEQVKEICFYDIFHCTTIDSPSQKLYFGNTEYPNAIIMQSARLLDKNNQEIFDGDIVKSYSKPREGELFVVEYSRGAFRLLTLEQYFDSDFSLDILGDMVTYRAFEVIGNIHEHPHLLKNESHC